MHEMKLNPAPFEMIKSGRKTIELDHVSKAFDGKTIINDFSYTVLRDDRIGIVDYAGKRSVCDIHRKSCFIAGFFDHISLDIGAHTRNLNIFISYICNFLKCFCKIICLGSQSK